MEKKLRLKFDQQLFVSVADCRRPSSTISRRIPTVRKPLVYRFNGVFFLDENSYNVERITTDLSRDGVGVGVAEIRDVSAMRLSAMPPPPPLVMRADDGLRRLQCAAVISVWWTADRR